MSISILILILISSFFTASFVIFSLIKKKTLSETAKIWWNFIKRNKAFFFKAFIGMSATIGAIMVGETIIKKIKKAVKGKVDEPVHFIPSPNKPSAILLETEKGVFEEVELPEGITSNEVEAAGYTPEKEVRVEILHETTDRRNLGVDLGDNSAASHWGG